MKGREINDYIAKFENLLELAERWQTDEGSVNYFKQGLNSGLQMNLLKQWPIPLTLDNWQRMAWEEIQIKALIRASVGEGKTKPWLSSRESHYQSLLQQQKRAQNPKKHDPDAMDIDTTRTSCLSKENHEKLMKERKCFFCKKEGHMARACPNHSEWLKGKGWDEQTTKAWQAKIEEIVDEREEEKEASGSSKEAPPQYDDEEEMVTAVWQMTADKRDGFLEQLAIKDF